MSISVYFCKKATFLKPVDNPVQKFCSEQAVEDILTTYTQENKSASVFLALGSVAICKQSLHGLATISFIQYSRLSDKLDCDFLH